MLVIVIGVASAIVLSRNSDAGTNPLIVNVTAEQFAWQFTYPHQGNVTAAELRLPLNRTVKLVMKSKDVIHSFWVPEFAQKQDVVPGITTTLVITPDRLGTYPLICTELCGLGHALMRSEAIVMKQAEFDAWAKGTSSAVSGGGAAAGKAVFEAQGCGACHTFKAAGATGKVGPDLDDALQGRAARRALGARLHPSVDRRPERLRLARLPEERDAGELRLAAEEPARRPD